MLGLLEEFQANYEAIIHSKKLSDDRKKTLLKNLLIDIEQIFWGTSSEEQSLMEKQKEAKQLCEDIQENLLLVGIQKEPTD